MKKIIVMTMAMLAMAFAFSSCGSDDDDVPGGGSSSANEVRRVYIFDNGSEYYNRQYKLTVGSETKIIKIGDSDLKKISAAPSAVEIEAGSSLESAKKDGKTLNVYSYDIPATMHGAATLTLECSLKDGELPEKVWILLGGYIGVGSGDNVNAKGQLFYMGGLAKDLVKEYIDRRNGTTLGNCVLK